MNRFRKTLHRVGSSFNSSVGKARRITLIPHLPHRLSMSRASWSNSNSKRRRRDDAGLGNEEHEIYFYDPTDQCLKDEPGIEEINDVTQEDDSRVQNQQEINVFDEENEIGKIDECKMEEESESLMTVEVERKMEVTDEIDECKMEDGPMHLMMVGVESNDEETDEIERQALAAVPGKDPNQPQNPANLGQGRPQELAATSMGTGEADVTRVPSSRPRRSSFFARPQKQDPQTSRSRRLSLFVRPTNQENGSSVGNHVTARGVAVRNNRRRQSLPQELLAVRIQRGKNLADLFNMDSSEGEENDVEVGEKNVRTEKKETPPTSTRPRRSSLFGFNRLPADSNRIDAIGNSRRHSFLTIARQPAPPDCIDEDSGRIRRSSLLFPFGRQTKGGSLQMVGGGQPRQDQRRVPILEGLSSFIESECSEEVEDIEEPNEEDAVQETGNNDTAENASVPASPILASLIASVENSEEVGDTEAGKGQGVDSDDTTGNAGVIADTKPNCLGREL